MCVLPIRVLYVEDDEDLAALVVQSLAIEGVQAHVASSAEAALEALAHVRPDLVLSDMSLPGMDGLALCRVIRRTSALPFMLVSRGNDHGLAVRALDGGADDFMRKPFDRSELVARIRAHVRRARDGFAQRHRIEVGELAIDLGTQTIELDGRPVALTSTELAVLAALAQHAGKPLTREFLLAQVHGADDTAFERSIDVLVSRLRAKLEVDPRRPRVIKTVRRLGYVLAVPPVIHSR